MDNKNIFICGADTQFVQETFKKVIKSSNSKIMGVLVSDFQKELMINLNVSRLLKKIYLKTLFFSLQYLVII